jgi:hypothetical protein
MIRFTLQCPAGHSFDCWFQSGAAYEALEKAGQLSCAVCGDVRVGKAVMAPAVAAGPEEERPLSRPASAAEQALTELRKRIEATSEDVGRNFATEARRIHDGEAPQRSIRGEARLAEARALLEDGIPVAPLPWPARGTN